MSLQETVTYSVKIRLQSSEGDAPTEYEFERLVADQMAGVLDEGTQLHCIAVFDPEIVQEADTYSREEVMACVQQGHWLDEKDKPCRVCRGAVKVLCDWCDEPATKRDKEGQGYVMVDYYCDEHHAIWGVQRETVKL